MLSDGSQVEEVLTTVDENTDYDIQIQGSDRRYPAIVLRKRYRGKGATIRTISKFGQHSALYADYEAHIAAYVVKRDNRRKDKGARNAGESSVTEPSEGWIDKALQSVVAGSDNSQKDTD